MGDDNRQLTVQPQAQPPAVIDDWIRTAMETYRKMLPNGGRLSDAELLAGAMYARTTGQDPVRGEFYIVPGRGVQTGYKGSIARLEKTHFHTSYRQMSQAEREFHELKPGDIGVICVFTDIELAAEMRRNGLTYSPTEGVGVVRAAEKSSPAPTGRSWAWKCQNRALRDACNHTPGFEWTAQELAADAANEILAQAEAEVPGYQAPPESAKLDAEQARAWVDKERRYAPLRSDTPERQAAIADAHARGERQRLERQWDDVVMGDVTCPYCGAQSERISEHANDCAFRQLFPKAAPRPEPPADCEDGEIIEDAAPAAEQPEPAAAANDDKILADIKLRFMTYAQQSQAPSSTAQRKAAAAALSTLFGRDGSAVLAFLQWSYGKSQMDELTSAQANAIIKFVGSAQQGGEWVPSAQAIEVAGAFRRSVLGQDKLFEE